MPKSVLWEINADQHHTSYLLGTIHSEDIGLASIKLDIDKYLSKADIIGTEIHLLEAKQFNLQDYILIDPLSDQSISDIHWEKLEQRCLRYLGLDISSYKQYKPLVILNIISIHILANNAMHQGLDEWIWEQGERNHKICIGLEDLVTHYNYLNQINYQSNLHKNRIPGFRIILVNALILQLLHYHNTNLNLIFVQDNIFYLLKLYLLVH